MFSLSGSVPGLCDRSHVWSLKGPGVVRSECGGVETLLKKVIKSPASCPVCLGRPHALCAVPLRDLQPMTAFIVDLGAGRITCGVLERIPSGKGYATVQYVDPDGSSNRSFKDRDGNPVEFTDGGYRRDEWSAGTLVRPLMEDGMSGEEVGGGLVEQAGGAPVNIKAKVAQMKAKVAAKVAAPKGKLVGKPKGAPAAKAKTPKEPKEQHPCRCTCGGLTGGTFVPGHDARFYGWLKKIVKNEMAFAELPKALQKEFVDIKGVKKVLAASGH